MKVDIEFIGPFREKAGVKYTSLDIPVAAGEMDAVGIEKLKLEISFRAADNLELVVAPMMDGG